MASHFSSCVLIINYYATPRLGLHKHIANLSFGAIGCSAIVSCSKWCSISFKVNSNLSLDILKQALNHLSSKVFQALWSNSILHSKRRHRLFLLLFYTLHILTNVKHKFENNFCLCLCLNIK